MNVPATVKAVGQYVKRAEDSENDKSNPDGMIIAFWCRQWAIEKSIPYFSETEVADFVSKLMDINESNKVTSGDKDKGKIACKNYANSAFAKADADDKSGNITKNTAKLFYNAATFLDILDQFDDCKGDKELEQKRVYAKWKAHDIISAIKEGRQPTPGSGVDGPSVASVERAVDEAPPAAPMPALSLAPPSAPASNFQSTIAAPSAPPSIPSIGSSVVNQMTSLVSSIPAIPTGAPSIGRPPRGPPKVVEDPRVQDAIELSNFAITSMKYMRLDEAKERLREAIQRLERS